MSEKNRKKLLAVTILLWLITVSLIIFGVVSVCKKFPTGTRYTCDNLTLSFSVGNNFTLSYNKGSDSAKVKGTYYIFEDIIELHYGEWQTDEGFITDSGIKIGYNLFKNQGSIAQGVSLLLGLCFVIVAILCTAPLMKKPIKDANKTEQIDTAATKKNYIQDLEKQINELQKTIEDFKNSKE